MDIANAISTQMDEPPAAYKQNKKWATTARFGPRQGYSAQKNSIIAARESLAASTTTR
jgi:hypothetical protein